MRICLRPLPGNQTSEVSGTSEVLGPRSTPTARWAPPPNTGTAFRLSGVTGLYLGEAGRGSDKNLTDLTDLKPDSVKSQESTMRIPFLVLAVGIIRKIRNV